MSGDGEVVKDAATGKRGRVQQVAGPCPACPWEVVRDPATPRRGRMKQVAGGCGECRKRKAGRRWIAGTTSSSSSEEEESSESSEEEDDEGEEEEDDEDEDEDEADVRDGTDVLEYESMGTVIPSSLKDTESEEEDNDKDPSDAGLECVEGVGSIGEQTKFCARERAVVS